ncbi:hypothetical protein IFM89_021501 [Coptis chinensis]|uniref:Serine carboxypeptidase-like 19 n=1 Tax=Coptis chinensis TaxID=261450 RepID=A0A835LI46_9MAGN|nr:hypothetical protein IFM89_021501 [Coptis chinensis]
MAEWCHLSRKNVLPIFRVLLLVVLVLTWSGAAVSSGFTVRSLPGFKGPLPFHLETGYVGVGEGGDVQLFYYFVHSERNPKEDPLVLWLVGGPRCTALYGITYEIGPLHFKTADSNSSLPNLVLNPDSWTQVVNMIFLDAPVGTGFSYWRTAERFLISDTISARHTNQFLQNWLTDHPQFLSNPLYIGGDSYAGVVNPVIVEELINGIEAAKEPQFNFKGYFLGNPLTSPYLENDAQVPFAHRMGLISDELYEASPLLWYNDIIHTTFDMKILCFQCLTGINNYHILEPSCYTMFSPEPKVSRRSRRSLASIGKYKYPSFHSCRIHKDLFQWNDICNCEGKRLPLNLRGGGHTAAEYKPKESFAMFKRWIDYNPL